MSSPFTIESKWISEHDRPPPASSPRAAAPPHTHAARTFRKPHGDAVCVAAIQIVVILVVLVCFRPSFVLTSRSDLELPRLSLPILCACVAAAVGATFLLVHFGMVR